MPSTMWTMISQARNGGREAVETLLRKYRPPVLAFVRNAVGNAEDAEDLVQNAFLALIEVEVLAKADKARGKFRSLLLAVTRHTISAARRSEGRVKRGGDFVQHRLDPGGEGRPRFEDLLAAPQEEEGFDRLWIQNLVRIGMNRLREECEKDGTPHFQALFLATNDGLGYDEVGARLALSLTDVKNVIHQARVRLKRFVLREVQEYASSRAEYESEIAYLMTFLA